MLRLVDASSGTPVPDLKRVAIWGLDEDLAAYIERRLRARWPELLVQHAGMTDALDPRPADLWICGIEPRAMPPVPTLWLGDVDRRAGVVRVGDRLWKCSTPITGRQLVRSVDELWRQKSEPTPKGN